MVKKTKKPIEMLIVAFEMEIRVVTNREKSSRGTDLESYTQHGIRIFLRNNIITTYLGIWMPPIILNTVFSVLNSNN